SALEVRDGGLDLAYSLGGLDSLALDAVALGGGMFGQHADIAELEPACSVLGTLGQERHEQPRPTQFSLPGPKSAPVRLELGALGESILQALVLLRPRLLGHRVTARALRFVERPNRVVDGPFVRLRREEAVGLCAQPHERFAQRSAADSRAEQ